MRTQLCAVLLLMPALASAQETYTGFWKSNCRDAFGLQIMPVNVKEYSVSFCGPGGCFEPGTYRPNTTLLNDPNYKIINSKEIHVLGRDGWSVYLKCTTDTHPKLRYEECPDDQKAKTISASKGTKKCGG